MTNLEKLQAKLDKPAILASNISQRWVSGFDYTDGLVIVTKEEGYLVCDFRYIEAAKEETNDGLEVLLNNRDINFYHNFFKDHCITEAYLEDRYMTQAGYLAFCERYPEVKFYPLGDVIEKIRQKKSEEEVENIVKAQRISERALEHIFGFITPDRTEKEVALELEFTMRSLGAECVSFDTICVSRENSSKPHGVPSDEKIGKGMLTMDFGCKVNGYCSDMTRTVSVGPADEEMKEMYYTVLRAQKESIEIMNPGTRCADVHLTAERIINAREEYRGAFGHGFGHSVGMEIHEMPVCNASSKDILEPGIVMTAEPGIYLPGKFGCRIEDMVLITEEGHRVLTLAPKDELIEL